MNQEKTPFSEGWIRMPRIEGETKISHYFKGDNSICAEVDLPKDGVVDDSPSIHCSKCEDKMKEVESVGDKKDDESPKQSEEGSGQDCSCSDEEKSAEEDAPQQEAPQGHHTTGNISSPGSGN